MFFSTTSLTYSQSGSSWSLDTKMLCLQFLIVAVAALLPATFACDTECCQSGGHCGSPVFDTCSGSWDYRTSCSPGYDTCCMPARVETTQVMTQRPPTPEAQTTNQDNTLPPVRSTAGSDTSFPPPVLGCGVSSASSLHPLIVGGTEATPYSHPWQASLQEDFGSTWFHFCGATLITDRFVVTAAHCTGIWADPAMFRVVLGEHDRSSTSGHEVIVPVSRIIVHEDWSADVKGSPNDLALLELSHAVEFNEYVQPACLPAYTNEEFTSQDECWISGWGDTKGTGNSNILQEVKLNITSYEECRHKWLTGTGGKDYVKPSHVCIGNGIPGACNGDSGGPLVCQRNDRFTLVGATSFGAAGCQEPDAPNVYTKISYFLPWIMDKINN